MKCKVCGGTGTSNTCVNGTFKPCTFCDGTGEYEPFDADVELDKLYPTEQTNEEWFATLSTKEKAKWLDGLIAYCFGIGHITETEQKKYQHIVADVEMWLKQPHRKE